MLLVSVIIPCYNVEDYIEECVYSVINQSYKNIEIICIDNNSTDETLNVLEKLKLKYPQILIDKEYKKGANAARNKGLKLAKGEWIQFLDADDLLEPIKIESQINLILKHKIAVDFIASKYRRLDVFGNLSNSSFINTDSNIGPFVNEAGITSSNLWNHKSLLKINGWDETIFSSQETDLMFRLIINGGNYIVDDNCYTIIRERKSGQISQRNPEKKWMQYIQVRLNYIEILKNNNEDKFNANISVLSDFMVSTLIIFSRYNQSKAAHIYISKVKPIWKTACNYGLAWWKVFIIRFFGFRFYVFLLKFA
jgi:glycosyltransferase involved in cell wall biosynthesis